MLSFLDCIVIPKIRHSGRVKRDPESKKAYQIQNFSYETSRDPWVVDPSLYIFLSFPGLTGESNISNFLDPGLRRGDDGFKYLLLLQLSTRCGGHASF